VRWQQQRQYGGGSRLAWASVSPEEEDMREREERKKEAD
jgi:hypothetical protein